MAENPGAHFGSFERESHATRFGMWLFLASEMLLFGGLFTLYAAGRVTHPAAFAEGIAHNLRWLGSTNTIVLITSSFTAAVAVHSAHDRKKNVALIFLGTTIACGLVFLALKSYEYAGHFRERAVPGGDTPFFAEHAAAGLPLFFSLYFLTTGAHAVHVLIGLGVLTILSIQLYRGEPSLRVAHRIELGALYWHLVDVIWIFLWPLYYLTGGTR